MKRALLRIAGIPVYIHWTFWLLIAWIIFSNVRQGADASGVAWSLAFVGLVITCVVMHEYGHALTAKRFGIKTKSIVLLPVGGVANIEKIPENPREELWITVMGPAVNLIIALVLWPFTGVNFSDPESLLNQQQLNAHTLLFNVFAANVMLFVFNLIPAFPMDGGRILRATIAFFTSWERATAIASRVGSVFAILFIVYGIFTSQLVLGLIGLFVLFAARSEMIYASTKSVLDKFRVQDVLITQYHTLSVMEPIQRAVELLLSTQCKTFVVADNGKPVGLLSQPDIIKALSEEGPQAPINRYMNTNVEAVDAHMPLKDAYSLLVQKGGNALLVTAMGLPAGIVDMENINELLALQGKRNDRDWFGFG